MSRLLLLALRGYQRGVSPLLPRRCRYHPTCSAYAVGAIREHGAARGLVLAVWRLLRCNPWSHGGVDYPRDQRLFRRPNESGLIPPPAPPAAGLIPPPAPPAAGLIPPLAPPAAAATPAGEPR